MAFVKGQSGNAGGRSKDEISALAKLKCDCRKHAEEIVTGLIDIFRNGDSSAARVRAAEVLLDRGYGKAQQFLAIENRSPFDELDTDEIRKRFDEISSAIKRVDGTAISPSGPAGSSEDISLSALH